MKNKIYLIGTNVMLKILSTHLIKNPDIDKYFAKHNWKIIVLLEESHKNTIRQVSMKELSFLCHKEILMIRKWLFKGWNVFEFLWKRVKKYPNWFIFIGDIYKMHVLTVYKYIRKGWRNFTKNFDPPKKINGLYMGDEIHPYFDNREKIEDSNPFKLNYKYKNKLNIKSKVLRYGKLYKYRAMFKWPINTYDW